jgi:hypothetical protein
MYVFSFIAPSDLVIWVSVTVPPQDAKYVGPNSRKLNKKPPFFWYIRSEASITSIS